MIDWKANFSRRREERDEMSGERSSLALILEISFCDSCDFPIAVFCQFQYSVTDGCRFA